MLRFLYGLVFRVFVVCALLVSAAKLTGPLRHDPMMPLFTNPDGSRCPMACLFGIRPGDTTFQEAVTLIQTHPMTDNLQLLQDDFTGTPTDQFGHHFQQPDHWSAVFMGQGGNVIWLQLYKGRSQSGSDDQQPLYTVCLKSVFNNATIEFPKITSELALMWHSTSFLQMVATLGVPQSISSATIAPTGAWPGNSRLESFYFDDRLVITHMNETHLPANLNHNFFDSICIYSSPGFNARFGSGFHGRVGAVVPWLGIYASTDDYLHWLSDNPATEPVAVMP
jgi:hypothetical protein